MFVRWHVGLGKYLSNGKPECGNRNTYSQEKTQKKMHKLWGIFFISVPGKVYAKCIEKKCREIVQPKLTDAHCSVWLSSRPKHDEPDLCLAANL